MHRYTFGAKLMILFLSGIGLLTACSKEEISPEFQIEQTINLAETAIEARSVSSFAEFIAKDYRDKQHKSRKALLQTVSYYFIRHQTIHLLIDIHKIKITADLNAEVEMFVGTAGKILSSDIDNFLKADLLRITVSFKKTGDVWQVISAKWHHASPDEYRKALLP